MFTDGEVGIDDVVSVSGDYLAEMLDSKKGDKVTDQSIFRDHAAKFEVGCISLRWSLIACSSINV